MIAGASLTLIQPNGGDLCLGQANYQIQWTAVGVTEDQAGPFPERRLDRQHRRQPGAAGSPFLWTVGKYIGGTTVGRGGDKVRIRAMSDGSDDYSDAVFTLETSAPPCRRPRPPVLLELRKAQWRGESVLHRETHDFLEIDRSRTVGKVQLDLMIYKRETQQWMIGVIEDNLPATGSYRGKRENTRGHTAGAGQYRIRVRSMTSNDYSDSSDAPFRLSSIMKEMEKFPRLIKPVSLPGIYQNDSTFHS